MVLPAPARTPLVNRRWLLIWAAFALILGFTQSGTVAHASYSTQQIAVDDDDYNIFSVKVDCDYSTGMSGCQNQNGQPSHNCFTPFNETFVHFFNYWYVGTPNVTPYNSYGCTGTVLPSLSVTITGGAATPWYCTGNAHNPFVC